MDKEYLGVASIVLFILGFLYLLSACSADEHNIGDAGIAPNEEIVTTVDDTDDDQITNEDEDTTEVIDYRYDLYPTNEIDSIFWRKITDNTYVNSVTEEVFVCINDVLEAGYHDSLTAGSVMHYHNHVLYYSEKYRTFYYYNDNDEAVAITNEELLKKPEFTTPES